MSLPEIASASDARVEKTLSQSTVHDVWENVYRNPASERLYERIHDWISRHAGIPAGGRVLDIGCGIGQHSIRLARNGFRVVAADYSADRVAAARQNIARSGLGQEVEVEQQDLARGLTYLAGAFDAVHCWGVLMHIPAWESAIAELLRVCRPGGRIILYEANSRGVDAILTRLKYRVDRSRGRTRIKSVKATALGVEYWVNTEAGDLFVRHSRIPALVAAFEKSGCRLRARLPGEFTERFSKAGRLAPLVHAANAAWYSLRIPFLAHGNVLVFEKTSSGQ